MPVAAGVTVGVEGVGGVKCGDGRPSELGGESSLSVPPNGDGSGSGSAMAPLVAPHEISLYVRRSLQTSGSLVLLQAATV